MTMPCACGRTLHEDSAEECVIDKDGQDHFAMFVLLCVYCGYRNYVPSD